MTDAQTYLAGIKERADAATAGPWLVNDREQTVRVEHPEGGKWFGDIMFDRSSEGCTEWAEDHRGTATFIAHSRTDLPRVADALLAVLDLAEQWQENFPYKAALVRATITEALEATL
jgi:hypothetical protein